MANSNNTHLLKVDYLPDTRLGPYIYPPTDRLRHSIIYLYFTDEETEATKRLRDCQRPHG